MRYTPTSQSAAVSNASHIRSHRPWLPWGVLGLTLAMGAAGCGPAAEPDEAPGTPGVFRAALEGSNGLSTNGLSTNGLSTNGLSTNGLSTNGLSTNGLSTNGFSTWFNQDPADAEAVMEYVVRCALPAGQTRTYSNPDTGVTHTWQGGLGLAPAWTTGQAATEAEQQVVSACLAAHINKYGVHVSISVLGQTAQGTEIPYTSSELATHAQTEACFFGNLFNDEGIYAANDQTYLNPMTSTARGCGLSSNTLSSQCEPLVHLGMCNQYCVSALGNRGPKPYYETCTYNGKTYRPITTRMRREDVYRCGDGTCQVTERCGTGVAADNCRADCGTCAP
ncbi:hypothetical protein [Pyxidicoccus xibeiensis]|uniref:hypothetical protein n=1 Tax=Pyxidicoccus xibeiensis TaxID=2906759 RepID=UPI0020A7598D|nr:hypothetical protein [Pyxidicoccus xibeiensis]MCP3139693.1 hypothetical protein [Pyxidicoccus xibeiensis]